MVGILDYGMGNLRSVQKAIEHVGAEARIIRTAREVAEADRLILPGVGAFADAIAHLRDQGLVEPLRAFVETGRPFLGICLGLQLLFDSSQEDGPHAGLGIVAGKVVRFSPTDAALKVPHMGWNTLGFEPGDGCPLLRGLEPGCSVYFVHSYYAVPSEPKWTAATCDYAGRFCAVLHRNNVTACQFHPEKSQQVGLAMLRNFTRL